MALVFDNAGAVAIGLVALVLLYDIVVKPVVSKKLTVEQLEVIDLACNKAVEYAEQTYKKDSTVDRNKLAVDYAFDVVKKAGILPDRYLSIIKGMIESSVLKLPKTHR